jgi:FlaA1/EpsC-like NDP-sugar epimerase
MTANSILGRDPVDLRSEKLSSWLAGQSVLVTGAAGSIGSELCREVARCHPKRLVGVDRNEFRLERVRQELEEAFPGVKVLTEAADISDQRTMARLMERSGVDVLYHAAAYKHVPIMESHVLQAVANNVLGSFELLETSRRLGVSKFILISTDKAVMPTSVMGASKYLAESIMSALDDKGTLCSSARFGNVLGSSGSVLPQFQRQIATGGPVTVTHPKMKRFFMDVREAVSLVLHASYIAKGGEVFVLDMGQPVTILELAERSIRLAGLEPHRDIRIVFTERRPGEKLHEETTGPAERPEKSDHPRICSVRGPFQRPDTLRKSMSRLRELWLAQDSVAMLDTLEALIPDYTPSTHARQRAKSRPHHTEAIALAIGAARTAVSV